MKNQIVFSFSLNYFNRKNFKEWELANVTVIHKGNGDAKNV